MVIYITSLVLGTATCWCPGTGQGEPRFGYVTCSGISDNIGMTLQLVIRGYSSFHFMHHNVSSCTIHTVYWLLTMADSRGGGSSLPCTLNCSLKPTQQHFKNMYKCMVAITCFVNGHILNCKSVRTLSYISNTQMAYWIFNYISCAIMWLFWNNLKCIKWSQH